MLRISSRTQQLLAREVLILSWLFGLALIGTACGGNTSLLLVWLVLYWARWFCWALQRADRLTLTQSGLFASFALGMGLLGWALRSLVQFVTGWRSVQDVGPFTLWLPAVAFILAAAGWLLMHGAIKQLRANTLSRPPTSRGQPH